MTDLKFNLLGILYRATPINPVRECELLNSGLDSSPMIRNALSDLKQQHLVFSPIGSDIITITSTGRVAYETSEQERHQQANEDRIRELDKKLNIAIALIPFIILALETLIDYLPSIVTWVASLFS